MKRSAGSSACAIDATDFNYKEKKPAAFDLALFSLFYPAASVYIPVILFLPMSNALRFGLSAGAILLSIFTQVRLVRSLPGAMGHILLLLCLGLLTGTPVPAGILGMLITSSCLFGWLCLTVNSPLLGALPLGGYALAALLLRNPLTALPALLPLPCALALVLALRKEWGRISSICRVSVTLGLSTAILLGIFLFRANGAVSPSVFQGFLESMRLGATEALTRAVTASGVILEVDTDVATYAGGMIDRIFNYLPALVVILFNLLAWMLHTAMLRVALGNKLPRKKATKMLSFDMSMASALIYFLALFLSLFLASDGKGALYSAAAGNLYLALLPGMLMTAWIAINTLLWDRTPSCLSVVLQLLVLFLLFHFSAVMLPLTAAFGAAVVLVGRIRRYLAEKQSRA